MTIFRVMAPILAKSAFLFGAIIFFASPSAKSPEDFVAPASESPAASKPTSPSPAAPAKAPPAKAVSAAPVKAEPAGGKPAGSKAPEAGSGKGKAAGPAMDTAKIHAIYLEGDFDQAIRMLESAFKNKKNSLTRADSVFIFKHLGVMYAATPATREKGRYFMHQLISIEPTAKILDMYASDTIYLIFRNAQEEFAARQRNAARDTEPDSSAAPSDPPPAMAAPVPAAPAPAPEAKPRRSRTGYWVAGGAVLALGTAGILFILLDDPEPKRHEIVLAD